MSRRPGNCRPPSRWKRWRWPRLKARLPPEAIALEMTALPRIVICHRGRALGLHLMGRTDRLSHAETSAVIALREAGMRIEVARGLEQALFAGARDGCGAEG